MYVGLLEENHAQILFLRHACNDAWLHLVRALVPKKSGTDYPGSVQSEQVTADISR